MAEAIEFPAENVCPECVQGKHQNCDGTTWDRARDEPGPCPCAVLGHRVADSTENDAPSIEWMLDRLADHSYDGGLHGTCYECPFASAPLDSLGHEARWDDVSNDPTEAYFRCSLPTRAESERLSWGEYAPCSEREWVDAIKARVLPPGVGRGSS